MPPSDWSNLCPEETGEEFRRRAKEQLRLLAKEMANPSHPLEWTIMVPEPRPIVPVWLYDLMQDMDDG